MNFRHVFSGDLDELNSWGTWAMGGHMDHHGLLYMYEYMDVYMDVYG